LKTSPISIPCTNLEASTQDRILAAAEHLFVDQGFAATSLRAIAEAANVNLAAAHYHFGSKQGLLAATLHARATPVNECRLAALDRLEAPGAQLNVTAVIGAYFQPFTHCELDQSLPRIIGRVAGEPQSLIRPLLEREFKPVTDRFIRALQRLLPNLTEEDLQWRFHFVIGAMIHLLAHSTPLGLAKSDRETEIQAFQRLQQFVVAGLTSPA
jgi:AcrR family transcriptional regulator